MSSPILLGGFSIPKALLKDLEKDGLPKDEMHPILFFGLPVFMLKVIECLLRMGIILDSHIIDSQTLSLDLPKKGKRKKKP